MWPNFLQNVCRGKSKDFKNGNLKASSCCIRSHPNIPARFDGTDVDRLFSERDICVLRGRIYPTTFPYSLASFLIEIRLPTEYPFQPPRIIILDPIYHPNVNSFGQHCCSWLIGGSSGQCRPTITVKDAICSVINIIDNASGTEHVGDPTLGAKYQCDREAFKQKALVFVLSSGRPREEFRK